MVSVENTWVNYMCRFQTLKLRNAKAASFSRSWLANES